MRILLIHGLGRSPLSLLGLAAHLRRQGHQTELLGYVAGAETFESIRARVIDRLRVMSTGHDESTGVCGHSLGGLLALSAVATWPADVTAPSAVVTLGTPLRPPRLASWFRSSPWFRIAAGDSGQRLADEAFYSSISAPTLPWLPIIGTGGPTRWPGPFVGVPNDGVVAVTEASTEHVQPVAVEALHTFLMNSAAARQAIDAFLRRVAGGSTRDKQARIDARSVSSALGSR
jgi:pimeloyl-ACP methyl ester carboxylesterase